MSISIKQKRLFDSPLPFLVTIAVLVFSVCIMIGQNDLLTETFAEMDIKQNQATATKSKDSGSQLPPQLEKPTPYNMTITHPNMPAAKIFSKFFTPN